MYKGSAPLLTNGWLNRKRAWHYWYTKHSFTTRHEKRLTTSKE